MAGYSATPLAKKLSLKPGLRTWWEGMPESVAAEIGDAGLDLLHTPDPPIDAAHIFVTERARLDAALAFLRPILAPAGFVWISWPKKAAKVPTDISEDAIRAACLPLGLIDVKVCAVDSVWSGLKLMIRRELR
ncbi:hypothetical protein PQ455_13785 [Sphingomonas naphthae]|uniref:DUF3052 family protein n=1 Tax=Sphingomonas naphthae TaxID=1813468 RepID=A0ABY7TIG2_9SPHN|nr:hypothetical protein [Sphingomonas naphthae]WCT72698.1 hypothetical protein PQ455_13785 [Sphingomonas naphthae]